MPRFSKGELTLLGAGAAVTIAAYAVSGERAGPVVGFGVAAAALSLLAAIVGSATEQLGHRLGAGATGMLQAAFGNLPELLICVFSLRAGLIDVVRAALVGAILANSLLILGMALLVGGLRHGTQRFPTEAPRMIVTLMLLAVSALAVPTLAHVLHTPAQAHEATLSAACAIVLLIVFASSVPFTLSANPAVVAARPAETPEDRAHAWSIPQSLGVLACAGVAAAFASEWFVDALLPATDAIGLSPGFTGLVIVAIAGNAVENVVGIKLAAQNKPDYALSVILNSSLQVALALTPVLVLASFFIAPTPLTLVLPPLLVAALGLTALVTAMIVNDGESIWLEGVALIGLYVMIAAAFFWG